MSRRLLQCLWHTLTVCELWRLRFSQCAPLMLPKYSLQTCVLEQNIMDWQYFAKDMFSSKILEVKMNQCVITACWSVYDTNLSISLWTRASGEGIVTYAAPNPFLLNKICLNQHELWYQQQWCLGGLGDIGHCNCCLSWMLMSFVILPSYLWYLMFWPLISYRLTFLQEYAGGGGGGERLVLTPLTERAQLSLTTALRGFQCGALIGPAATGKTETIRDLAKVIVFYISCQSQPLLLGMSIRSSLKCQTT